VSAAIDILGEELRIAMALCGAASIAELSPALVRTRRRRDC
jgi:isopentenyl diphosphate isomerase/L-lactate dehydrogenase-like FMN-dependent dehydrogenase